MSTRRGASSLCASRRRTRGEGRHEALLPPGVDDQPADPAVRAESGIELDYQVVDLFTGEQYKPEYAKINPSSQVPVLDDGDFRLTESSAILKYLADKVGSPAYPRDLRQRGRVNERMDWFNSGFYRDFSYGFVYPQIFPFMRRPDDTVQAGTIAWGRDKARFWLKVLDGSLLGAQSRFVCGNEISIADYFGVMMVVSGEAIGIEFAAYPNISRWLGAMKSLKSWPKVNEAYYKYVVDPNKGTDFVRV